MRITPLRAALDAVGLVMFVAGLCIACYVVLLEPDLGLVAKLKLITITILLLGLGAGALALGLYQSAVPPASGEVVKVRCVKGGTIISPRAAIHMAIPFPTFYVDAYYIDVVDEFGNEGSIQVSKEVADSYQPKDHYPRTPRV